MVLDMIFLLLALVCFLAAAVGAEFRKVDLLAAGLFFVALKLFVDVLQKM